MATAKPVTIKDGTVVVRGTLIEHVMRADGSQVVRFDLEGKKQTITWGAAEPVAQAA